MTYDQWKTADPNEPLSPYLPEEPEEATELEIADERCRELEDDLKALSETSAARIKKLEADLAECLAYFKDRYDVVDGDYGEPAPNKEMQLGIMIDETLHGIQF